MNFRLANDLILHLTEENVQLSEFFQTLSQTQNSETLHYIKFVTDERMIQIIDWLSASDRSSYFNKHMVKSTTQLNDVFTLCTAACQLGIPLLLKLCGEELSTRIKRLSNMELRLELKVPPEFQDSVNDHMYKLLPWMQFI
jgi:hypothetical protein